MDTNHTSKISTSNIKNIHNLTSSNMNISLNQIGRLTSNKLSSHLGPNIHTTTNQTGHGYTLSGNIWNKKTVSSQIRKQF